MTKTKFLCTRTFQYFDYVERCGREVDLDLLSRLMQQWAFDYEIEKNNENS